MELVEKQSRQQAMALEGLRVLDLAGYWGTACGKVLGDLGADVIKIEKPEGDECRRTGPFYHDDPDPEKSLYWFAWNTSKRGVTLNLETADGRDIFKKLVKTADFVIESFPVGCLSRLGLDYETLSKINKRVVMVSISPFGQEGPCKDYKGSDLTIMAMGGLLYINGDDDRPPVRITVEQANLLASSHAATAALVAHHHCKKTGDGQLVDVSAQQAVLRLLFFEPVVWEWEHKIAGRHGNKIERGGIRQTEVWSCKDGQVCFRLQSGIYGRRVRRLTEWMEEEGMAGSLKGVEWESISMATVSQENIDEWEKLWSAFFLKHTREELLREATTRQFFLLPCNTCKEIMGDEQLAARDYWVKVRHEKMNGDLTYLGNPYKMSLTPWRIRRRAPALGEHNREIFQGELGLSTKDMLLLFQAGVI